MEFAVGKGVARRISTGIWERARAVLRRTPLRRLGRRAPEVNYSPMQDDLIRQQLSDEILRLHEKVDETRKELAMLRATVAVSDEILPALNNAFGQSPLPSEYQIEASFHLTEVNGFYRLESDGLGREFRWTGPKAGFAFDLFVERTRDMQFEFEFLSTLAPENEDHTRAFADGAEIALRFGTRTGGINVLRGVLPARTRSGPTRLLFVASRTVQPSRIDPSSKDVRALGFAFHRLLVRPA